MSGNTSIRAIYEPIRTTAFGAITSGFLPVGTSFVHPVRLAFITNNTNADIIVSYDGVTSHSFIPMMSGRAIDYCSDRADKGGSLDQPANTIVYIKYNTAAPTSGAFYFELVYAA